MPLKRMQPATSNSRPRDLSVSPTSSPPVAPTSARKGQRHESARTEPAAHRGRRNWRTFGPDADRAVPGRNGVPHVGPGDAHGVYADRHRAVVHPPGALDPGNSTDASAAGPVAVPHAVRDGT